MTNTTDDTTAHDEQDYVDKADAWDALAATNAKAASTIASLIAERDKLLNLLASREADIARMQHTAP